ncbi:MAG: c-type cytochrome [Planctomycetota bacterium]|jgi:putative heme-binding domain-containing protein|nr:c-type cytochrome [Planctomycetota bacterium]
MRTFLPIIAFTLAFLAFFAGVGWYVDKVSGAKPAIIGELPVSVESGKILFWGKGTCQNCHKIGGEGSNTRCPDLAGIGATAAERAKEINEKLKAEGKSADYDAHRYMVESIAKPRAYISGGFQPIMPKVFETVPLSRKEVLSVLLYLQTQGGDEDQAGLEKYIGMIPEELIPPEEKGRRLFHEPKSPAACAQCHKIEGKGTSTVGPDLTGIGGVQTAGYLLESILFPSKTIVAGYEQYLIRDEDEVLYAGQVFRSSDNKRWSPSEGTDFEDWLGDDDSIYFVAPDNKKSDPIAKDEVYEDDIETGPMKQKLSMMPADFAQKLEMQQVLDIVAYLMSQK